VTATATITSEVLSATTDNGVTGTGYVVGDLVTFTGITGVVGYVATVGSGVGEIQSITFTQPGTSRGSFEALPAGVTNVAVVGGSGTLGTVSILFRAKAVVVTEKGSGYTSAPTVSYTNRGGITVNTITLTTDSGAVGSATNQENSILMTAFLTGGSAVVVDIIKQVSTNRYKVTDGTRTGIVKLVSSLADAAGEGSVRLVDSDGGTYFATKITAHKAVITRGTGVQAAFPTGAAVKWNMTAATADSLLIDNA
jgi:hypothetical protein